MNPRTRIDDEEGTQQYSSGFFREAISVFSSSWTRQERDSKNA